MKNYMLFVVMSAVILILLGCNQERATSANVKPASGGEISKKVVAKQKERGMSHDMEFKQKPLRILPVNLKKLRVYIINNEKFTTGSETFARGERLYNLAINQSGRIKGSVVIVLEQTAKLSNAIKQLGQVSQIAQDTYRVKLPVKSNVLVAYQRLSKMPLVMPSAKSY